MEPPAGTQLGTIMEQAAAIISHSQVVPDHNSPAQLRQPAPGWLSQAVLHAAQTQKRDMPTAPLHASQIAFDAAAAGMVQCPGQPDAAASGVLQCPPNQADADTAAKAVCLSAHGGQEQDQSNAANVSSAAGLQPGHAASQSGAEQGGAQMLTAAVPVSLLPANATDAKASVKPARVSQIQAGAAASAVLQDGCALPAVAEQGLAAAASKQSPAVVPAAKAADDAMSQETEEDLGDIAPTEVQLPDQTSLLRAGSSQGQRSPSPVVASAGGRDRLTESSQSDVRQADAGPRSPVVGAEVGSPQAVCVHEAASAAQQVPPDSPTPDLQLQLTYDLADHHAEPAGEAASPQLRLQLTAEPPVPEAAANVVLDESCREQAELDLNLDTQLPDLPADKAPSVCAPVGGQKSPALNRGWWNQPWSVAQHVQPAEDVDSLPAGLQAHAQLKLCVYVAICHAFMHRIEICYSRKLSAVPQHAMQSNARNMLVRVYLSNLFWYCSWLLGCIRLPCCGSRRYRGDPLWAATSKGALPHPCTPSALHRSACQPSCGLLTAATCMLHWSALLVLCCLQQQPCCQAIFRLC